MDFNFLFRRFFNNSSFQRDSFDSHQKDMDDPFFEDPFKRFNCPDEVFHEVEDMFNNIFSLSFGVLGEFPKFVGEMPEHLSPRSIMLKDSDDKNKYISENEYEGSNAVPGESKRESCDSHHAFSFSKISSIRTVYLPDGVVEEHQTVTDSNGKKSTHVRRSIGDTTHEVITKSDKQGLKEKEEHFINMDEKERDDFEKLWSTFKRKKEPDAFSSSSLSLPPSNPSYFYLLKKFFGSSQKEEPKWC